MNEKLKVEIKKRLKQGTLSTDMDLHVHTVLSDGSDRAEDVVLSAIDKGIKVLGFSDHSHLPGVDWSLSIEEEQQYRVLIKELREKYKDQIDIYCGIEQDALSGPADAFYDYAIGSAHAVKAGDGIVWADGDEKLVIEAVNKYYDGDFYSYAEAYYDGIAKVFDITGCDIVGHFDLLTKFNEGNKTFDTSNPRYVKAWKKAADKLISQNMIFEINTGAISRGYRLTPYPSNEIIKYLADKNAPMILCSDSHDKDTLAFQFMKYRTLGCKGGICRSIHQ